MKLVLAEKPSVAQSIAKVLGAAKREDGYLEGNGYVVSWCVGHLVELAQPEVYDAKYSKWAYADLPIFPMDWQYEVSAGTKKQFGILKKLMAREDVASLVCATDAGREGELIFRLVYHKAGCRKPFERLWISSMEDVAIKEGFENLRSGTEYDALYDPIAELAFKLDRFAENFDPYEYMDQVDDVQAHIQEIKADLAAGNTAPYREFLNTAIEEAREETAVEVAKVLKSQLDKLDSPKRESVMEKLAQAAEKAAPASPSPKRKEPER